MTSLLRSVQRILDLLHAIELARSGVALDPANEFEWITAFAPDDLTEVAREVYAAYARARSGEIATEDAEAVIHEWQESAWAMRSADVRAAFDAPSVAAA